MDCSEILFILCIVTNGSKIIQLCCILLAFKNVVGKIYVNSLFILNNAF